jgi:prepilin-type N-terminal cleavage/methylation domain-containing protein
MNHKTLNSKGFTLIESLVAIAILVTAVIGATAAIQSGISSYTYSKDQITAFYLAQEGFEQIRNIRDQNNLEGRNWLAGIAQLSTDPCYFTKACTVSPVETVLAITCGNPGQCPFLRQNASNGFYGYDSTWTPTIFKREITLESINSQEVAVTVRITWNKGIGSKEFKARENLFNWPAEITP